MRFESPLLILGLSVPLALCQGGTVEIQIQDGQCVFQGTTPNCMETTGPFANANGNDCSDVTNSSHGLCGKNADNYTNQVINMYGDGGRHISFAGGWCWLPALEDGATCTVPAPSSSSVATPSSTALPSSTPAARRKREF